MIRFMVDRGADIDPETAKRYNIEMLPFIINLDGESMVAGQDFDIEGFYRAIKSTDSIPTTSQMAPGDVEAMFRKIGRENQIIYVSISARGSGINNTAQLVARQLCEDEGFDITVIDSEMYTLAIGLPVIKAAQMAENGASKEEVVSFLKETYKRDTAYFFVDDLTYLRKGGRIKATTMAISSLLDIKPILMITDGLVEAYRKVRGSKKAMGALVDYVEERMEDPHNNEVMILDIDSGDGADYVEELVRSRVAPAGIIRGKIGPVITAHAGSSLIGVYFKHKKPYTEYKK